MPCKGEHTGEIRVVADEPAAAVNDGVHCAYALCALAYFVKIRHDGLLIRYRHVYAAKLAFSEKIAQLVGAQLVQLVFVIGYLRVNFARIAASNALL